MAVRRLNPTTPGQRFRVANAFAEMVADTNVAIASLTSSVTTMEFLVRY